MPTRPGERQRTSETRSTRLVWFLVAALIVLILGAVGYRLVDPGHADWFEALYMSVITITTTGFQEYPGITVPARIFTIFLLLIGYLFMAVLVATLTESFVTRRLFWRDRKMQREIDVLSDHIIIAGFGRVGSRIAQELSAADKKFVVIEQDEAVVASLKGQAYLFVQGDASDEEVLQRAGIDRASGLATCLSSDADNLYLTLATRELNPHCTIVARVLAPKSHARLQKAGATRTISLYDSGGAQMANALIRPAVLELVEVFSGQHTLRLNMEEVALPEGCALVGKSLREAPIRGEYGVFVIAIHRADGAVHYNPDATATLHAGDSLLCIGEPEQIAGLSRYVHGAS